ncbi:DUF5694 domain-containing protein [Aequorivita sp. F47161]|uniref:DUF5694 domain-containing protein n=1 Tax=Aequorivita vitellina TaxID=2874475 RepID=A0A9X1QVM2_9FLAO|nr:DUF5694 domain-containing protein [Aequorivita vitellina]MCG2417958.1 DUF5694 domain-containing protein [Aequorivita vitellina]
MNTNQLIKVLLISAVIMGSNQVRSQNKSAQLSYKASKEAILLGVYHFDNPGMDTYNLEIDDYFTKKRQAEIQEVVALLAAYKPHKIFVEFLPGQQPKLDSLFALYASGRLTLKAIEGGQNEVYQLGFRLAKQLGINEIIAVDHPGVFLAPYADFISDTLSIESYQEYNKAYNQQMEKRQKDFTENTVKENLIHLNDWQQILNNHNYYNNIAITVKDTANVMFGYQEMEMEIDGLLYQMRSFDFNNIGVALATEWYRRNLFIYRNILEQTEDNDRILIIFGSGHLRHLHQFFDDNPEFKTVATNNFLNK